jgi:hypothetical protein
MQMNALSIRNANRERPLNAGQSGTASARFLGRLEPMGMLLRFIGSSRPSADHRGRPMSGAN